ncbi:MAG: RecX family transcriptional regulator, partial [Tumebacillaceae bacterium]
MEQEQQQIELKGGRLTALSVQKGNPDRLSLFIDDQFMLGVRRELVIKHGLVKKGMEVTREQLVALQQEEEVYKARDLAAKYLTARMRTRKQVSDYLAGKGYDEDVVAATVEWLAGYGYLDDGEYAKKFVEGRVKSRPRGRAMLRWELQQKG